MLMLLLLMAVNPDPDLLCKNLVDIKFDQPGTYQEQNFDWAQVGDFKVWSGEGIPHKVINTKARTECELGYPHVRSIKKFESLDLLFVDAYRDKVEYTAVIEIKNCQKLWELEIITEASALTFNSSMTVKVNKIKGSVLDKCTHCWNDKTEACRNIPVSAVKR